MIEKELLVILKGGQTFLHRQTVESEEEWWQLIADMINNLLAGNTGIFTTHPPYAIYRVEDISGYQFGDAPPPNTTKSIGFRSS